MTTQQTQCFGCRQFENRHILKLLAYLTTLSFRTRTVATDNYCFDKVKDHVHMADCFSKLFLVTVQ